jgi:pilus assembly protein Flp/PilA
MGVKMKKLMNWLKNEESGQGMVEYGLIIAVVALVVVVGLRVLGNGLKTFFNNVETEVSGHGPS